MVSEIVSAIGLLGSSALIANYFLVSWQQRNWINQQQFASATKDFSILCKMFEEITSISNQRHFRMKHLVSLLHSDDDLFRQSLDAYRAAVIEWNEKLPTFLSGLTMYVSFSMAKRLEDEIQAKFYALGTRIETLSKMRMAGISPSRKQTNSVMRELNALGGHLRNFHKRLLIIQGEQQEITYHGALLKYEEQNLKRFSNWYLFKAMFVADVESLSVVRSSPNVFGPLVSRGHGPGVNEIRSD